MSVSETAEPVRAGLLADVEGLRPGDAARLQASRCDACGRMEFPGRADCPWCGAAAQLVAVGPLAVLAGFTEVLHPVPGSIMEPPYGIGVARFADGLHVIGLLATAGDDLALNDPIEACLIEVPDGRLTYAFRPA